MPCHPIPSHRIANTGYSISSHLSIHPSIPSHLPTLLSPVTPSPAPLSSPVHVPNCPLRPIRPVVSHLSSHLSRNTQTAGSTVAGGEPLYSPCVPFYLGVGCLRDFYYVDRYLPWVGSVFVHSRSTPVMLPSPPVPSFPSSPVPSAAAAHPVLQIHHNRYSVHWIRYMLRLLLRGSTSSPVRPSHLIPTVSISYPGFLPFPSLPSSFPLLLPNQYLACILPACGLLPAGNRRGVNSRNTPHHTSHSHTLTTPHHTTTRLLSRHPSLPIFHPHRTS
ncbi:hypothetical protein LZ31DRAFT_29216 [Colletotrichum somersetense]|nr:hypothetical protein LZ31DRAFT_29216 [Colletotrichum somersetense]